MSVYFRVEFKCLYCKAEILYEDEVPKIFKDRNAVTDNNKAQKLGIDQHYLVRYIICNVCEERIYFA